MNDKVGLVFAGGGAKGAYQIGVWQALIENDIKIDAVSGASIGALNACLFAAGDFERAKGVWLGMTLRNLAKISILFPLAILLNAVLLIGNQIVGNEDSNYARQKPLPIYFGPDKSNFLRWFSGITWTGLGIFLLYAFYSTYGFSIETLHLYLPICVFFIVFPVLPLFIDRFSLGRNQSLERLVDKAVDLDAVRSSAIPVCISMAQQLETYEIVEEFMWREAFIPISWGQTSKAPNSLHAFGDEILAPKEISRRQFSSGQVVIPTYPIINELPSSIARLCIIASMALPVGIFRNIRIGKSRFMDGGVIDNAPAYPFLVKGYRKLYIVHLNPTAKFTLVTDDERLIFNCVRAEKLRMRVGFQRYIDADTRVYGTTTEVIHITPSRSLGFSMWGTLYFSKAKAERLMELGYNDAKRLLETNEENLETN